jgi:hypothetical protein
MFTMDFLDKQMQQWSTRLRDDLRISPPESNQLATTISKEVSGLSDEAKQRVKAASPIPFATRIEELGAFQLFMDLVGSVDPAGVNPAVVRAQVAYQNYICFVYLGESCFNVLKKELPTGSTGKKCCRFLTDNPVRAFRNAVAHSNWRYLPDFSGLEYWARKGADLKTVRECPKCKHEFAPALKEPEPMEEMLRFEVSQQDLSFWQYLARCTSYASFLSL